MFARQRGTALLIVLLAVVGLWGCSDSDDIVTPDFDPQDVQAGAQAAALVGPTSELTQEIVMGLMQGALGAVAPMTSDTIGPTHETSVYLENGVEATCVLDGMGGVSCEFGGMVSVDGYDVSVTGGSMSVSLSDSQPPTGAAYDVQFGATASNATLGSSVWSTAGSVQVDELGEPVDYDFEMSHTVTPAGGSPMSVTVVVSPTQFELVATGPMGGTVRFALNRLSMTGTVYVNGYQVATIAVEGSCTAIDFTSEEHQDVEVCPTT
jgi:hypothetical protein